MIEAVKYNGFNIDLVITDAFFKNSFPHFAHFPAFQSDVTKVSLVLQIEHQKLSVLFAGYRL